MGRVFVTFLVTPCFALAALCWEGPVIASSLCYVIKEPSHSPVQAGNNDLIYVSYIKLTKMGFIVMSF